MKLLIVEDEPKIVEALSRGLKHYGYTTDAIANGKEALERITLYHEEYDLVILDLNLPDMEGPAICTEVRENNISTPIIILTARDDTDSKIELLKCGADDYLAKPFSLGELEARIQALLRRPKQTLKPVLKAHDIELNLAEHTATKGGEPLNLTQKEFALLEYFMRNPNRVISRDELLSHIWDFNYTSFFSNSVDVHIKNLRKKLEHEKDAPRILETVRGVGYRFTDERVA